MDFKIFLVKTYKAGYGKGCKKKKEKTREYKEKKNIERKLTLESYIFSVYFLGVSLNVRMTDAAGDGCSSVSSHLRYFQLPNSGYLKSVKFRA